MRHIKTTRWFWVFCCIHLIIWTAVPALTRGSVDFDTLESIAWGNQWQWGYNKHPPLAAWLSALFTHVLPGINWPIYFAAQVMIIIMFWAVWRLARQFLADVPALIAVILLEGVLFVSLNSTGMNPNQVMMPLWALLALYFYHALTKNRWRDWLLVGVFAGLNVLAKYEAPLLFVSMLAVMLLTQPGRKAFSGAKLYVAAVVGVLVIAPHIIWSVRHGFSEVHYALVSSDQDQSIWQHVASPWRFFIDMLGTVIGSVIMSMPFWRRWKTVPQSGVSEPCLTLTRFQHQFLLCLAFGPLVLTLLFAAISGSYIKPSWGVSYFFLFGVVLMVYLKPILTWFRFKCFLVLVVLIAGSIVIMGHIAMYVAPYVEHRATSLLYYPYQSIAKRVTQIWHRHYHQPLPYVVGSHYLTAAVSVYSPDHPKPFLGGSVQQSAWINPAKVRQQGAMFVWQLRDGQTQFPAWLKKQYPRLEVLPLQYFQPMTAAKVKKVAVRIGILPPLT